MMRQTLMMSVVATLLAWGAETHIASIREYTRDDATLVELSADGKYFLTQAYRKIPNCPGSCHTTVFAVYNTGNGRLVRELVVDQDDIVSVSFARGNAVRYLRKEVDDSLQLIEWDPISGATSEIPFLHSSKMVPVCILDDKHILTIGTNSSDGPMHFGILSPEAERDAFLMPLLAERTSASIPPRGILQDGWRDNCNAWRSGTRLLVPTNEASSGLVWVSTEPSVPARMFRNFPGERIYGYAISPDGKLVAVVTAARDAGEGPGSPNNPAFLHVDDAESGTELGKFQMDFPDKPVLRGSVFAPATKHLDNYHFEHQFARNVAISPDHTKIAVAYGVYSDPNGIAYFGLYSLSDGHRIATIKGDTLISGFWWAVFHLAEDWSITAHDAPLWGAMQFSPDSRVLYATSDHLHLWNVSGEK
jgi:hypothetical protein